MSDRQRLPLSITDASARVMRWGGDEPNAEDIPESLSFSTPRTGPPEHRIQLDAVRRGAPRP